ncbi:MAG TPA: trehalose-phosphatase [Gemmatimonadaceae bacterium]|jgi:trehalose 6-phosphate phosphatase
MRALSAACAREEPVIVGFDFDGTLAAIVQKRGTARMRRITRNRVLRLAKVVPCAVVSGRTLADLTPRVRGIPWAAVIGSHGIEPFFRSKPLAVRARSWRSLVGAELAAISDVDVEHKPYGMSVHYRHARDPQKARRDIQLVLGQLEDARVLWGPKIADVLPLGAPAKDHGVERLRRKHRARHVIYVGDAANDEDVFRFGKSRDWVTVRVKRSASSHARFYIPDQLSVDRLLETIYELTRSKT